MVQAGLARIEAVLFHPDRRIASLGTLALLLAGALVAMSIVALAGPILSIAAVVAMIGGILMFRDIRWGFAGVAAVIGLLPFAALPFKIGFTPTFLDLVLLVVYLVWILRIATRRQPELVGTTLGVPVLLFVLLAVFAFANGLRHSSPTSTSLRNFAELSLGILFFFVLVNTLRTQADLDLFTGLIIVAGAGAALIAIVFYVIPTEWTVRILDALARFNYPGGAGALRYIEDDPANPMRAIGTQVDPNVLGGLMILTAGLTAPQLVSRRPILGRPWMAFTFALQALALCTTYSRGSLLGLAAGLLVIGVLRYRRLLLVGLLGAALLLLLPQAQAYVSHLVEGLQLQDRATLMRLGEYKDALTLITRYPWFGVGFTGSPDADLYVGVSSLYLLMAEEMGVVGTLVFVGIVIGFFASLRSAWQRALPPRPEALLLGLAAAITAAVVGGFLDHYLFNLVYPHMAVLFWACIGLGMSAVQVIRQEPTPDSQTRRRDA